MFSFKFFLDVSPWSLSLINQIIDKNSLILALCRTDRYSFVHNKKLGHFIVVKWLNNKMVLAEWRSILPSSLHWVLHPLWSCVKTALLSNNEMRFYMSRIRKVIQERAIFMWINFWIPSLNKEKWTALPFCKFLSI